MADRLMGALSLCRKAGKMAAGNDMAAEAVTKGRAAVVFLAADTSPGTARRVTALCEGACPVYKLPLSQQDVAAITRKPVGVLAITDESLAALCLGALADKEENV